MIQCANSTCDVCLETEARELRCVKKTDMGGGGGGILAFLGFWPNQPPTHPPDQIIFPPGKRKFIKGARKWRAISGTQTCLTGHQAISRFGCCRVCVQALGVARSHTTGVRLGASGVGWVHVGWGPCCRVAAQEIPPHSAHCQCASRGLPRRPLHSPHAGWHGLLGGHPVPSHAPPSRRTPRRADQRSGSDSQSPMGKREGTCIGSKRCVLKKIKSSMS